MGKTPITGKRILIVDDEADVLETLSELLSMYDIKKSATFLDAKRLLEEEKFDIAILDIMGVNGYDLLQIANRRAVIAIMLTAHALTPEDIVRSFKGGAASYIPKEKVQNIAEFLIEILEARERGEHFWWRWLERWASYYDKIFGPDWQREEKQFWDKFPNLYD